MSLMFEPLRKYATFSGRARRKEYWLFTLFTVLVTFGLTLIFIAMLGSSVAMTGDLGAITANSGAYAALAAMSLFYLFIMIPSIAVMVRRIHDTGNSGWWALLMLTGVGQLIMFIFALIDGTPGPNQHGPDPKGRATPAPYGTPVNPAE